ncbi:Trm112p-like protein [Giardia muris]|uniref:Trm112p-like protein n=1 Tax=Giardia muris TaxID=5742 RepID=A0A4Z1SWR3_GIAMU|nr:Trm112p-like protein [Giardia muris]|eukprot:TNJ30194.1 Trm112p-like protein [Giardia muris]
MYLSALAILACPECHEPFHLTVREHTRDEIDKVADPMSGDKLSSILSRLSYDALRKRVKGLELPPNPEDLYDILFREAVVNGVLRCESCQKDYDVKNRIPRLVMPL